MKPGSASKKETGSAPVRITKLHHLAPLYFLLITLVAQVTGGVLFAALHSFLSSLPASDYGWRYFCAYEWCMPLGFMLLPLWGVCALVVAALFRLSRSWQMVNLLAGPAGVLYLSLGLPEWLLLVPIGLGVLTYLPAFWTRVPYYPTSVPMYHAVASELPQGKHFRFIDLGCGFSGLLKFLSVKFPQCKFTGVEIGFLPFLVSKLRFMGRRNVTISFKSFWGLSLSSYDVVYAFLAPGPMPKLWEKAKAEMTQGSILLVNSFEVPHQPDKVIEVEDERECRLLVYQMNK